MVKETLSSGLTGIKLIDFLNKKVYELYKNLGITDKITDPKYRFTCGCIAVKIIKNKIIITYIGNLGFRINGNEIYQQKNQVDIDNAEARAKYIEKTGDIAGSREYIKPLLLKQFEYQNNPNHPLGYGVIDGTNTPSKFVKTFEYPLDKIKIIELFSDGYFNIPNGTKIEDWENAYKKVEQEDPNKWKGKTKSTKSTDDRTVVIIKNTNSNLQTNPKK